MTPFDVFAALTMVAGLLAAGAMLGWSTRGRLDRTVPPTSPAPPLVSFKVQFMQYTMQTDARVDLDLLETLANSVGRYTAPLPSEALQ